MKCDVFALRQKYGHQALRGFTREAGHIGEYDEEEEEGRASVESEDEPDTIEMEDVVDEESWGNRTLTPEAVAKFLEDRSNDGYARKFFSALRKYQHPDLPLTDLLSYLEVRPDCSR